MSTLLVETTSFQAKKFRGQEMMGVPPPPLIGHQPAPLVQQAGTCICLQPFPLLGTHSPSSDLKESQPPTEWMGLKGPFLSSASRPGETQTLLKMPWEEMKPPPGAPRQAGFQPALSPGFPSQNTRGNSEGSG